MGAPLGGAWREGKEFPAIENHSPALLISFLKNYWFPNKQTTDALSVEPFRSIATGGRRRECCRRSGHVARVGRFFAQLGLYAIGRVAQLGQVGRGGRERHSSITGICTGNFFYVPHRVSTSRPGE